MARSISKDTISQVEKQTDIVALIGAYTHLEERGRDWWGCCPFHKESTASFHVEPYKGFYYCFGCHASGTAVKFVMEMEKLSFPLAIEFLAKKAGVAIEYEDTGFGDEGEEEKNAQKETEKLKADLKNLYERVAKTFHHFLLHEDEGKSALFYAQKRGLKLQTIEKFKLGFAPEDRHWLRKFLKEKSFSDDFLNKSGLFSKKYPDAAFFSNRLIFPIFDRFGGVVAFGGRDLSGAVMANGSKVPKYLNSGDLVQYKKGETLYALNFALDAIRHSKRVIFCEGYMDVIAYHQCSVFEAVAPLGTALTTEQIKIVKPFVKEVLLSFDNDNAGFEATRRAILMLREVGLSVKVIQIPGGKDPAEIVEKSGESATRVLTNIVENAIFDSTFLLTKLGALYNADETEGKKRIVAGFFPYILSLSSQVASSVQIEACQKELALKISSSLDAVKSDFAQYKKHASFSSQRFAPKTSINAENINSGAASTFQDGKVTSFDKSTQNEKEPQVAQISVVGELRLMAIIAFWVGSLSINENSKVILADDESEAENINSSLSTNAIIEKNNLAKNCKALSIERVVEFLSDYEWTDDNARSVYEGIKSAFLHGNTDLLSIAKSCSGKDGLHNEDVETVLLNEMATGAYKATFQEAAHSLAMLKKMSLERERKKLESKIRDFVITTDEDRKVHNSLMQELTEVNNQYDRL